MFKGLRFWCDTAFISLRVITNINTFWPPIHKIKMMLFQQILPFLPQYLTLISTKINTVNINVQGCKVEQLVGAWKLKEEVTGSNAAWAISFDYLFNQLTWVILSYVLSTYLTEIVNQVCQRPRSHHHFRYSYLI